MTQSATRQVTYTLASRTSGVPGLEKFASSLERIRAVQDQIKRQGDVLTGLRDKTATVRLKFEAASIDAELKRVQNRTVNINVKFGNMQAAQNDVKTFKNLLASVGSNLQYTVTVKTTALSVLNSQFDIQIVKLQSLISQLRALGSVGGAGGGRGGAGTGSISAANRQLLGELEALNNKWQRGDILAADFGRELTALQAKLRTAAAGATAGSAEFSRLDSGLTRLTTSLRSINTDAFQRLRTDAGAMRAAFDSATAGVARNSSQFQAAAGSYSAASAQIIARLQAMSTSGNLTTTQLGQVNRELQRLAREANTIGGSINHAGLSGSVVNSFAMLGGQFGALAFQGAAVVGMFRSVQAAAGGAGLALAGLAAGVLTIGGAFVSLGSVGVREIQKTQHGLNILQANGVKDLGAMERSVSNLKTALGGVGDSFAKSDLTESLADTVKAGLNADESLTLMATSAKLAAAENINLNDATGLLLKNIRQYGGTVLDAAKTGDYLAKSGNLAAGTANDLSVGLGIVAGTGKQAKIEMYNLLGMLVELDNKGMNAADVGANGLRAAIAALGDPSEKARGILKGLGIATEDLNGKARPAGDIMVDLGAKLRGMGIVADKTTGELSGNGEALRVVSGIMDNRAAAAVINLTGEWRTYGAEIKDSRGELDNYATTLQQGLAPALKGLKTAWADAGGTFAKSFAGPMTEFLGTLTQTVKELDKLLGLVGDAKDAKEIQLSLKINASDDLTTMIMKFLLGTGEGVKQALSIPVVPSQELIDAAVERQRLRGGSTGAARATMVKNDLNRNGLLPQLTGAADRAQYDEIRNNVPKYEKLWDDFIDAAVAKARAGGLTLGNTPAAQGPFVGEGPLLPGQTRVESAASSLVAAIGMAGRRMLNDFGVSGKDYHHDGAVRADAVHNGIDYGAPRGTPIKAAFTGAISYREDAKNGKVFELADAAGNRLVGIHLDQFNAEIQAALARGAKQVLVTRGQKIGTVGNTGTTAGSAPHLHLMGYAAGNPTPVDARTIPFVGGPAAASLSAAASGPVAATAATKTFDAYMTEARRILGQIEKYAPQGSAPDGQKWAKATAHLKTFADQNDVAAQALAYVQLETKKAEKSTSQYGQTFDRLKGKLDITQSLENLGRPAGEITKQLSAIGTSASQAAEAERKRNGETAKYRALLDLAGDAAKRLKTIQDRKPEQTPLQRDQQTLAEARAQEALEKSVRGASRARLEAIVAGGVQKEGDLDRVRAAESEIKRRTDLERTAGRTAAQEQKQLAQELAGLKIDSAKSTSSRLKTIGDQDVRAHEGDLKKQLELTRLYSQQEFDRQQRIAIATRKLAYDSAAGKPNEKALREKAQAEYLETVENARVARLNTMQTATAAAARGQEEFNKTLEDGVKAGNEALDTLDGLNLGGRDLAATAQKLTASRAQFDTLYNRIVILRDELGEPGVADAWTQSIEDMGKAGQLSAVQVAALRDIIQDLNAPRQPLLPDNLAGRGVTNTAAVDDASRGALASGEGDRLLAAMGQMGLDDVGAVLARLVEAGLEKSQLGQLIRDYLDSQAEAIDASLREFGGVSTGVAQVRPSGLIVDGGDIYQTEEEIRNLGVATDATSETFFNLAEAIQNAGKMSREELENLIRVSKLGADAALELWTAWNQDHPVDISAQLDGIMQAQALLDRLEGATDPVQIQALTGDIGTFLASDVGKLLPDGVRDGLTAGVEEAKEYGTILAGITSDAVADGLQDAVTRTANAGSLPTNRFKEFADQINGGDFDLSNPEIVKGLYEGLDISVKNGELTVQQLELIKLLVDSINSKPVDVLPVNSGWEQLEGWNIKLGTLEERLKSGAVSQKDFNTEAFQTIDTLEGLAYAALEAGDVDLASNYITGAQGLRELIPVADQTTEALRKQREELEKQQKALSDFFGKFSQTTEAAGGIAKSIGGLFGEAGGQFGDAMGQFYSSGMKGAEGIARVMANPADIQGWAQAIQGVLGYYEALGKMFDTLNPGLKAWQKSLLEVAETEKKALSLGTGNFKSPWADQLKKDAANQQKRGNAGFWKRVWWDLTGSAPEIMKTESAKLLAELQTIFAGLGEGLAGALSSSITDAFLKGNMADFAANFEKSFDQVVGKVVLQTMVEAAIQEGAVATDLADLTQAIKDRRYNDIPSILGRIKQHAGEAMAPIAALAPSLPGYGSGGDSGGSGSGSPTIFAPDKRLRDELLYRYENATDPAEKERLRKELLGLDPTAGGGGVTTTISATPTKTEAPDWAALNAGISRLVDFGAQSDQIARMESETARMNRESAGVMAQAAGMMLLAAQGRGSGAGPGNINF